MAPSGAGGLSVPAPSGLDRAKTEPTPKTVFQFGGSSNINTNNSTNESAINPVYGNDLYPRGNDVTQDTQYTDGDDAHTTSTTTPKIVSAVGTLSISSVVGSNESSAEPVSTSSSALKFGSMPSMAKKPAAKKLGAKKLTSTSPTSANSKVVNSEIESFESVEKRHAKEEQEKKDFLLATKLQYENNGDNNFSSREPTKSRVSSITVDDSPAFGSSTTQPSTSRYAPLPSETASSGSIYRSSPSASNSKVINSKAGESYEARSKYSNAKAISSDQYFGRDDDHAQEMKGKLNKFSSANAISSDMLYHDADPFTPDDDDDINIDKLKDSVKDFFTGIQKNFN